MLLCRKKKSVDTSPQTPLFIGLVAAAIGAVWYLRKKSSSNTTKGKKKKTSESKGSAFKFPDVNKKATNLPRNKTNKKNKAKRRAEKAQKKADKCVFALFSLQHVCPVLCTMTMQGEECCVQGKWEPKAR